MLPFGAIRSVHSFLRRTSSLVLRLLRFINSVDLLFVAVNFVFFACDLSARNDTERRLA